MKPQPISTTGVTTTIAPSPLISTYVTTPGGAAGLFDYRGGAATSEDLYKEKVSTYVNQRTN
jgi:hypothetical protein